MFSAACDIPWATAATATANMVIQLLYNCCIVHQISLIKSRSLEDVWRISQLPRRSISPTCLGVGRSSPAICEQTQQGSQAGFQRPCMCTQHTEWSVWYYLNVRERIEWHCRNCSDDLRWNKISLTAGILHILQWIITGGGFKLSKYEDFQHSSPVSAWRMFCRTKVKPPMCLPPMVQRPENQTYELCEGSWLNMMRWW